MARRRVTAIAHDWRMRRLLEANLEKLGLEVQSAASGHYGLQLVSESQPDLILLDSDIPDMLLADLLENLGTRLDGQIPIIVLAADPPARGASEAGTLIMHLVKPFAVPALLRLVDTVLEN